MFHFAALNKPLRVNARMLLLLFLHHTLLSILYCHGEILDKK